MSSVYPDTEIDIVKITFTESDGVGTATHYFSTEYYAASEIYSGGGGSPEVWPILVEPPVVQRGVGVTLGIRYEISMSFYGKAHMQRYGLSFMDLFATYESHGAAVELLWYVKSTDAVGTDHVDGTNIRQTLEVTSMSYDDVTGIATLSAADKWFNDKEFSKRLDQADIAELRDDYDGVYGSIPFGAGVLIDAPITDPDTTATTFRIFAGMESSSYEVSALNKAYVENLNQDIDERRWLEIDITPTEPLAGNALPMSGASTDLQLYSQVYGRLLTPSQPVLLSSGLATIYNASGGNLATTDGKLYLYCYLAEDIGTNHWQLVGEPLSTASIDVTGIANVTAAEVGAAFFPTIVLSDNFTYAFILWWNSQNASVYPQLRRDDDDGDSNILNWSSTFDFRENAPTFTASPAEGYAVVPFAYEIQTTLTNATSGLTNYSYVTAADTISTGSPSSNTIKALNFKLDVDGIKDDGSGTITGTVSALIDNPSDIVRFVLLDSTLGLGLTSGDLDTGEMASTRTSLNTDLLDMVINVNDRITCEEFISEISRQSRCFFYKQRDGKLSFKYPTDTTSVATTPGQTDLGNDFQMFELTDASHDQVVNDFLVHYFVDSVNPPSDPSILFRTSSNKLTKKVFLNKDDSTGADTTREAEMSTSETLYGKRRFQLDLPYYDNEAAALKIMRYYADRYQTAPRRLRIRLLRKDYESYDLFDNMTVTALGLPKSDGTDRDIPNESSGTESVFQDNGIPRRLSREGTFTGQVVEVVESGAYIEFVLETVNSF